MPVDTAINDKFENTDKFTVVDTHNMPDGYMGLDIGPATVKLSARQLKMAGTVV